jgi:cell division protein FtsB
MSADPLEPIIITNRMNRRPPRRRRVRIGPWVWRAGLGAVILGVGGTLLTQAVEPYTMRHQQKLETSRLKQSLADAKAEHASLVRETELMKKGPGLEMEARRLGYIRQGEIPLQISIAPEPKQPR